MILDPVNSNDKRVWDILNTVVVPATFKPEMTLEDIKNIEKCT